MTTSQMKTYKNICKTLRPAALLNSTLRLLEWDQETQMPEEGLSIRAEQNNLITELSHKIKTSKKFANQLSLLIDIPSGNFLTHDLPDEIKASIKEMRKDYLNDTKLTSSFIKKFANATTNGLDAWKTAREKKSFKLFTPYLNEIVDLTRKKAELLGYKEHPYNALLDLFEPGITVKKLDSLFDPLKNQLISLIPQIQKKHASSTDTFQKGNFPIKEQQILAYDVIKDMGLLKKNYSLKETAHPFCSSFSPHDIRLSTHYYEDNLSKGLFAVIHECGHALYEKNLPFDCFGTPLGEPASFGVHESQSRIWETFIGQSYPFWQHYFPKAQKLFPQSLTNISLEQFFQSLNHVSPSLIRIYADEVTYNLHIILRYEIEKGLLDGSIQVKNIPEIWNTKMQDYFGITPKNDSEGCLQDVHWSMALFGYFPSYTLGNLYAGTLYSSLKQSHTDYEKKVKSGDFSFINTFLKEKIHTFGRRYSPVDLIEKATNTPFSPKPYLDYLEQKYL